MDEIKKFLEDKAKEIADKVPMETKVPSTAPDRKTDDPGELDPIFIKLPNDHTLVDRIYGDLLYYSTKIRNTIKYIDYVKLEGTAWLVIKNALKGVSWCLEWQAKRLKVDRYKK